MRTDETRRGIRIAELALELRAVTQPACPQFRPHKDQSEYPVRGHCTPLHRPGLFVIPSIDEYSRYCTGSGFALCPWFRGIGEASTGESGYPSAVPTPERRALPSEAAGPARISAGPFLDDGAA